MCVIYLIYTALMLFTMNIKACKLTIQTFEFWLKILYCILWWIFRQLSCYYGLFPGYTMIVIAIEQFMWLEAIIVFSFLDGWYTKRSSKICLGLCASLFFSLKAFMYILSKIDEQSDQWYCIIK